MGIVKSNRDFIIKAKMSERIIWHIIFYFHIRENLINYQKSIKLG